MLDSSRAHQYSISWRKRAFKILFRFRTPYVVYQKRYWAKALELVGARHRAGVPILAGTDL